MNFSNSMTLCHTPLSAPPFWMPSFLARLTVSQRQRERERDSFMAKQIILSLISERYTDVYTCTHTHSHWHTHTHTEAYTSFPVSSQDLAYFYVICTHSKFLLTDETLKFSALMSCLTPPYPYSHIPFPFEFHLDHKLLDYRFHLLLAPN